MKKPCLFLRLLCIVCLLIGSSFSARADVDYMSVPPELIPSLESRVKEGDPQAAYALALGYRNGHVKPFNAKRMLELAHMANLGGCRKADLLLAKIYCAGCPWEIPMEFWRGACYMSRYMYRGNPRGDVFQGQAILLAAQKKSVDVGPYLTEYAWELLENAASQGSARAYAALGTHYYFLNYDLQAHVSYMKHAAQLGDLSATGAIGFLVEEDPRKFKEMLQEGVSNGDVQSLFLLAMVMLEEDDTDSTDLAMSMLREAAERGMAAAQSYLGQWLLAHGGDRAEAIDWLKKAAYLESESAQRILDSLED